MRTTYALPRPWSVAPLLVLVIAFVAFSLPPYLTLDPAQSRIPIAGTPSGYYPMLVAHVIFGSVAILTCCLQVWPWLRARYPDVHRRIGLAYVFAGVLPAGVLGLILGAQTAFGPVLRASNVLLAGSRDPDKLFRMYSAGSGMAQASPAESVQMNAL